MKDTLTFIRLRNGARDLVGWRTPRSREISHPLVPRLNEHGRDGRTLGLADEHRDRNQPWPLWTGPGSGQSFVLDRGRTHLPKGPAAACGRPAAKAPVAARPKHLT